MRRILMYQERPHMPVEGVVRRQRGWSGKGVLWVAHGLRQGR